MNLLLKTTIFCLEDYLEKFMDHINSGPYQLHKNNRTTKIKATTLKQLKTIKGNEFIDNKIHYYHKLTIIIVISLYLTSVKIKIQL